MCEAKVPDGERGLAAHRCGQPAMWAVVTRKRDGSLVFYTPRCDAHLDALKRRHERLGARYLVARIG
jgi:hypothetical protein